MATKQETVSLKFTGSRLVRRVIGEHEWTVGNGFTADVPLELAADLLTSRERTDWQLGRTSKELRQKLNALMGDDTPEAEQGEEKEEVKKDG